MGRFSTFKKSGCLQYAPNFRKTRNFIIEWPCTYILLTKQLFGLWRFLRLVLMQTNGRIILFKLNGIFPYFIHPHMYSLCLIGPVVDPGFCLGWVGKPRHNGPQLDAYNGNAICSLEMFTHFCWLSWSQQWMGSREFLIIRNWTVILYTY